MHGDLSRAGGEHKPFHADDIADIAEMLPYLIVQALVFPGSDIVPFYV